MSDRVILRVPASTSHVSVIRAAASALAATLGFTYDRITDLHIAVDEVCSRIQATSTPRATRLEVVFQVDGDGITVTARGDSALRPGAVFLTDWSRTILSAVTDRVEVSGSDGPAGATFVVSKG